MEFPSCQIQKDNFRVSQGKQIRTKNKESFEFKIKIGGASANSDWGSSSLLVASRSLCLDAERRRGRSTDSKAALRCSCRCRRGFQNSLMTIVCFSTCHLSLTSGSSTEASQKF